jgi:hypothetical protein
MMPYHNYKPSFSNALRLITVSVLLFAVTGLGFASKGGGDKKKHREFENSFTPINASSTFSLKKAQPLYTGSMVTFHTQTDNRISLSSMITYQHGNTTLILPYQYKVEIGSVTANGGKSNLQFLGVRIQMSK